MLESLTHSARDRMTAFAGGRLHLHLLTCAGNRCRRVAVAHRRLRRDGIFLEAPGAGAAAPAWLCSPRCLESALGALLETPAYSPHRTMTRLSRMPFRLQLLRRGVLSENALRLAQEHAGEAGTTLSRALLALGCVSEEDLAAAHAAEAGCAFYRLSPAAVGPAMALPPALAERYEAVTVHGMPGRVVVGFVHSIHRELLTMVETMTASHAEACFITATHWARRLGLQSEAETASASEAACGGNAAAVTVACALRLGAETVRVVRSGSVAWVRCVRSDAVFEDQLYETAGEPAPAPPRA